MKEPSPVEKAASKRATVNAALKYRWMKDKLLLTGIVGICLLIAAVSLWPSHKLENLEAASEKTNSDLVLSQNMELIQRIKDSAKTNSLSILENNRTPKYTGTRPPKLRNHIGVNRELLARMNAPSTFYIESGEAVADTKDPQHTLTGQDSNSQFLNQQNEIASVSAQQLPHPAFTIPAGELIPATLETAINSELAGMTRAITTRDVYSLEGNRVLIPKGSTLVGQFNASVNQGQSRIFVVWNRVQMSNGLIVTLNSASTDRIGRSGSAADYIDRHFFERFGQGVLLSVLGAYTSTAGVNGQDEYNSMAQYRMNMASNFQQAASQTLQQSQSIAPTLQVNQGSQINVFVAHDLDFFSTSRKG